MGLIKYKLPELVAHYLQKWRNSSETCKIYMNENNSQHKNSKKENKKKRNQGKAKWEKKPFFWSIAGWSNRAITIFTVMSPSPKLLL